MKQGLPLVRPKPVPHIDPIPPMIVCEGCHEKVPRKRGFYDEWYRNFDITVIALPSGAPNSCPARPKRQSSDVCV